MKLVVLLIVILVVVWLARAGSRRVTQARRESRPPLPPQEEMVACSQCGLHLPRSEALPGRGGQFCSAAHRAEFERARE